MARLDGKTALVTGGANGIGRQVSKAFSVEGANVIVADRLGDAAEVVASEITSCGGTAISVGGDVSDEGPGRLHGPGRTDPLRTH